MMARLTTLPDALRGGAWPSPDTLMAPATFKFIFQVALVEVTLRKHSR